MYRIFKRNLNLNTRLLFLVALLVDEADVRSLTSINISCPFQKFRIFPYIALINSSYVKILGKLKNVDIIWYSKLKTGSRDPWIAFFAGVFSELWDVWYWTICILMVICFKVSQSSDVTLYSIYKLLLC